jgi:surfeit locus 1 family protein
MKRIPVVSTSIVILLVVTMVALGAWQLQRREQKEALLASFARNSKLPETALPRPPVEEALLFRHVRAMCLRPDTPVRSAGRSAAGVSGYRFVVRCADGAEGPGFAVELGVSADPRIEARWPGGEVAGLLTRAPDSTSFIERLFRGTPPPTPMIVPAHALAPGLSASRPPDPANVPNNHLAYAVQWFAFAAIALLIYALALRRRGLN